MKKKIIVFILLCLVIMSAFVLTSCVDRGIFDEDYVEVEKIRIKEEAILLSPTGDTSMYQLEVEILPTNATNQNLTYFIPSKYLEYVTVDNKGSIKAKAVPVGDIDPDKPNETPPTPKVPLTITSTSNSKASMTVMITIEEAVVKEINFNKEKIEMLYKGESVKLEYSIKPYHAQDGRDITFSSLNPEVASVSEDGVVTPLGVGHTRILAVGKTRVGKEITGRIEIVVKYAAARYSLVVTNVSPKFKQTVNDKTPITFNLLNLEPNSDPNPRIMWYVGKEKVSEMDGMTQYEHKPQWENPQTYNITVRIAPKDQPEFSLSSQNITIYNEFSGFEFVYGNNSKNIQNYMYGQEVTFHLNTTSQGIEKYKWYLRRIGQSEDNAVSVAETLGIEPDLQVNLNLDGDYILDAKAYNAEGILQEGQGQSFSFNVNRYITGDTLIFKPDILNEGIPPEIYNYFIHNCGIDGNIIEGTRKNIGSTELGQTFYYKLNEAGLYKIEAQGILNGVPATVNNSAFSFVSELFRVNEQGTQDIIFANNIIDGELYKNKNLKIKGNDNIYDIVIDGANIVGEIVPIVYWSAVSGVPSYYVEVTKENGEILLLNSTEDINNFGKYYCLLPKSFVSFEDKFKVRIKQKGGEYSHYACYGYERESYGNNTYFDKIDSNKHSIYLSPIDDIISNGYLRNMRELGHIFDYIISFEPSVGQNSLVGVKERVSVYVNGERRTYDRQYTIKIFINFDFEQVQNYYPFENPGINLDEIYMDLYKAISGAQYAYCETANLRLEMLYDENDGGFYVNVYKDLNSKAFLDSDTKVEIDDNLSVNYAKNPYGDNYDNFNYNSREPMNVYTTDQLYIAMENGKKPLPQTDITNKILTEAIKVVKKIIGEDMTDREKVTAFFDYLILNTVYEEPPTTEIDKYNYNVYHLEGVFLAKKAVCDGLSKAMSLFCGIENIPCYKVSGYIGRDGHAWNKIKIEENWYNSDITWGSGINSGKEYINHDYLLMSDADFKSIHTGSIVYGEYQDGLYSYDYYSNTKVNTFDLFIENELEFIALLNSFGLFGGEEQLVIKLSAEYLKIGLDTLLTSLENNDTLEMKIEQYIKVNSNNVITIIFTYR